VAEAMEEDGEEDEEMAEVPMKKPAAKAAPKATPKAAGKAKAKAKAKAAAKAEEKEEEEEEEEEADEDEEEEEEDEDEEEEEEEEDEDEEMAEEEPVVMKKPSAKAKELLTVDCLLCSEYMSPTESLLGFHFGHAVSLMPQLRVLALPISLVDARSVPQQLTQAQTRDNAAIFYYELERHVTARIHLMGSVGPGLFPVTIMGLHHGPILLYLPGPSPSVEHAQIVLNSIPEVPPGLQVYESGAFLGDVAVFVTADPEAASATALVASTIGQGLDNLIVVALAPSQQQLGNAVYMDPFYTTARFSNPANGHYIRRTRISLPGDGVALACIARKPAPALDSRRAQTCNRARQLGIQHPSCQRPSIATPFGRRHLPRPTLPAEASVKPSVIELSTLIPEGSSEEPAGSLAEFQQWLRLLNMPWHQFWRSAWDGVMPAKNLPFPKVDFTAGSGNMRRFHIFTDGSKLGSGAEVQCGWGLVLCGEDPASNTFRCGGFSGGPLEPFLCRPLGASPSSFDAEIIACIMATCWAASLPAGSEVVVWHDCQGAGSLLAGDCSNHASGSVASLLRPLALWCQFSGIALHVRWVPSHSGHFLNELVDSVAKAGARQSFPAPALPAAFWKLLASPFLPWAWLDTQAPGVTQTGMPPLANLAAGRYEARDPVPPDCVPVPSLPEPMLISADLCLRFLTCNVQTLKDKRPLVMQQLTDRKVNVAGLQETRDSLSSQCFGNCFFEFAAAAEKGEGGVTLLFNRNHPYGRAKGQSLFFDRSHFTCVHADPRCIAVQVRAPHLQILCVCAHAPHSGQPLATISEWWRNFEQAPWLTRHKGRIVLLIDSNAQLGSIVGEAVQGHAADEENTGGTFLRSWVEATDSFLPSTVCDADGQCVPNAREPTWFSPSGHGYRIDFVGLPRAWTCCKFRPCTWPDFELLNKDHIPAVTDISLQIQARPSAARESPTFPRDPTQWPRPALEQLKKGIQQIPSLPWDLNVHEHVRRLQQAVHQAGRECKPQAQRRCRAFISEPTRDLLDGAKLCKKRIANLQELARKLASMRDLGRVCLSCEGWTLSDVQGMLADLCLELRIWRRSLRNAVAWDKSGYVRRAHQRLLDNCDPFDARQFFDALRALRPPGPGKILRKQMRSALLQQLPDNPLQQGGIPQSLLQGVHQVVKMQADIAAAVGASTSALFLDVSSAYYRVLRQAFQGPVEDDRQICQILSQLGVRPESLHCVCEWLASTNLVAGASAHQQRLLQEYLSGTFFTLRGGSSLVHTRAGTRPGDAIADTLFALVQADFLAGIRDRMEQEGMLDDPVVSQVPGGPKLLAPVWADDSVVLLAANNADRLLDKTTCTAGIVHSEFTRRGMAPNYTRGKSEVLFIFRGRGTHRIFCTRQILRDPALPLATRRMCLSSLALSCVTTTAPTWGHLNKAESAAWRRGYVALLRSLHRDNRWTGKPSLPSEQDVCLATGMPSPAAYLKGQRLMHFRRVCLTQPVLADLLLAEYQASNASWLSLLHADVQWLSRMAKIPENLLSDFPHALADWSVHHEAPFKAAIRKALRNLRNAEYEPDWAVQSSRGAATPEGPHKCEQCVASFATKHALAAHRFAKHGQACVAREYLHGTACPACLMQFWTTARVTRHLMHDSPQCLRVLQDHAFEGDAGSRKICTETADLPATRLYGPLRPFHVQISEFASRAAEGDSSLSSWLYSYRSPAMQ
ncbi:unnamed protein product, partial [Symbiodinium microadriaticum]